MNFAGGPPAPGLRPQSATEQSLRRFRFPSAHLSPSRSRPAERRTMPLPHPFWPAPQPARACPATQTDSAFLSVRPFERTTPLPQLQRRQRKQRKNQRGDPKPHDHLRFAPTKQFEMVMNGGHPKNALAAQFERAHLQNHRDGFQHKNAANEEQQNLLLDDDRNHAERPAQRERPHISHENLRRMRVVPQKAERRADERAAEHRQLADLRDILYVQVRRPAEVAAHVGQHREGACRDDRTADGETVQTVREVDGVRRTYNYDTNENEKWNKSHWPEMR